MSVRIICILWVAAWVFQNYFPYLTYEWGRRERWENFVASKNNISPEEIHTISFPLNANIHWEKKDKEFELSGKMYDVISMQKNDTAIIIRCVSDSKEDGLIYAFRKAAKNTKKYKLKNKAKKIKHFTERPSRYLFSRHDEQNIRDRYKINVSTLFSEVISPPPQNYYSVSNT